ncbi:MAG TPA: hypothetical protein DG754_00830 [Bacteroidales bacterium]|jgi:hypothetical protein|nr:hypothetical protein [Bacteroidales bacterium]
MKKDLLKKIQNYKGSEVLKVEQLNNVKGGDGCGTCEVTCTPHGNFPRDWDEPGSHDLMYAVR